MVKFFIFSLSMHLQFNVKHKNKKYMKSTLGALLCFLEYSD